MHEEYKDICQKLIIKNSINKPSISTYGFPTLNMFKNTFFLHEINSGKGVIFQDNMGLKDPSSRKYWYNAQNNHVSVKNFKSNEVNTYSLSPVKFDEFTDINFNGVSLSSLNVCRTSDGNRYNINLAPNIQDKTAEIPGTDGMYLFNSLYRQKNFSVQIAFDSLTDSDLRKLRKLLDGKEICPLEFSENKGYIYQSKVTGAPAIKVIPFDDIKNGATTRIYKGEGSIQFTAYFPYSYWIQEIHSMGENDIKNFGDLPSTFIVESTSNSTIPSGTAIQIGDTKITINEECSNLKWDSKTGIVTANINGKTRAVNATGNTCGTIPVEGILQENIKLPNELELKYYNWYY